ncbi:MAG: DNA repair protein RadA [Spirochaetes bacterium]|nr:MAG: DNA repair protein RadA [Spirochaetota bacterium]
MTAKAADKKHARFVCTSCGAEHPKWAGRCDACGSWNTIAAAEPVHSRAARKAVLHPLADESSEAPCRVTGGIAEFDLVTGGGIVPGSVILIGGDPGIGKSTLALQIACSLRSIYFSGEESPLQIRQRAVRLAVPAEKVRVSSSTTVEEIQAVVEAEKPELVVIDSVQTLSLAELPGYRGSVGQIRESTARLVELAKRTDIPIILIGHITKDGAIAGPKMLEHLVDTVLYFEGDFSRDYRILRAFKNRFGSVNEIGLFRMTEKGLQEIRDKNSLFLSPFSSHAAGSAVSASLEGSRIILFEVQSLVTFTNFSNPRRMADGFDLNRLILIAAVLEKHGMLKLGTCDVFVNVAGGFSITETASDLAVAMAIASSLRERPIPAHTGFAGEIALSGEVRPVPQCHRRIQEFARSGFKTLVLSKKDSLETKAAGFAGEAIGVANIAEAMEYLF